MSPRLRVLLKQARGKLRQVDNRIGKGEIPLIRAFELTMIAREIEEVLDLMENQEAMEYLKSGEERCPTRRKT